MQDESQKVSGNPEDKPDAPDNSVIPQLLGLSSASLHGAFTTSGSVLSLLYDAMTVARNNGRPPPEKMPSTHFALVANEAARGQSVRFDLSGFCTPAGAGRIRLEIGGQVSEVTATEERFYASATAVLNADAESTPVLVSLDLPEPADGAAAMLTLDSIDIELEGPATETNTNAGAVA
jgi:hypothetical protein